MRRLHRFAGVVAVCAALGSAGILAQESATGDAPGDAEKGKSVWQKMFGGAPSGAAPSGGSNPASGAGIEGSYSYSSKVLRMQAKLHKTQAVDSPEIRAYIDSVDARSAGPARLEAFSHLLANQGFLEIALVYSSEALRLDPGNASYWTNHATIARFLGDNSSAIKAYRKAIEIDPGLALAHYNLGVSYDALGKYDDAIDEYVKAFTIDPTLGEVSVNPQVVNNPSYAAAILMLYQRRGGHQPIPLIPVDELNPEELTIRDDAFD